MARLDDVFLEALLTASKPSRRSITAAKRWEKGKKERRKKKTDPKIEKPKDVGHFLFQKSQSIDFCACPSQNVVKRDGSGKKRQAVVLQMYFRPD